MHVTHKQSNMKTLAIIGTFLAVHFGLFFILSAFGLVWIDSYRAIIGDGSWFFLYTVFIGWWTTLLVCKEVYEDLFEVM